MAVRFIGVLWENHLPVASHWQTLLRNVGVHLAMSGIQIHNLYGDRHWLHSKYLIRILELLLVLHRKLYSALDYIVLRVQSIFSELSGFVAILTISKILGEQKWPSAQKFFNFNLILIFVTFCNNKNWTAIIFSHTDAGESPYPFAAILSYCAWMSHLFYT